MFYKKRLFTIGIIMLLSILLIVPTVYANEITHKESGGISVVADEQHVKLANELKGAEISYGDFIETVLPEALNYMPDEIKEQAFNTQMNWNDINVKDDFYSEPDNSEKLPQIYIGSEANCDVGSGKISYDAGSRVWLPNPYYRIPYMEVTVWLEDENEVIVPGTVKFESDTNCYKITDGGDYLDPAPGYYRVHSVHNSLLPAGYTPQTHHVELITDWYSYP